MITIPQVSRYDALTEDGDGGSTTPMANGAALAPHVVDKLTYGGGWLYNDGVPSIVTSIDAAITLPGSAFALSSFSYVVSSGTATVAGYLDNFQVATTDLSGSGAFDASAAGIEWSLIDEIRVTGLTGAFEIDDLAVDAPNEAPTGAAPASVTVVEDAPTVLDLSATTLADADGDVLDLTLAATAGTLDALAGGDVAVVGAGTDTLILSGLAADLAAFLANGVSYTGALNVAGVAAATISATLDDGVQTTGIGDIAVDITAVNDAPTGSAVPDINATEDLPVDIDLSVLALADPDGDALTLVLSTTDGHLSMTLGALSFGGVGTTSLSFSGTSAQLNDYLADSSVLQFTGAQDFAGTAEVSMSVSDSAGTAALTPVTIIVANVNDAPTGEDAPLAAAATEDEAVTLNLDGLALVDADGDVLTLTLTATDGSLAAVTDGNVAVVGSGTAVLALTGTAAELTGFLAGASVSFTGDANFNGSASVAVIVSDGIAADVDLGVTAVTVAAVNDAPTGADFPAAAAATEDVSVDLDLSALVLADAEGDTLTLTLTATDGVLSAVTDGDVTVTGSGTGTLVLSGTAAELNTYLDNPEVGFLGATDFNGDAAVNAIVSDGVLETDIGPLTITVAAVNDAPTGVDLPLAADADEDVALALDLTGLVLADVDGDALTLTLAATNGTLAAVTDGHVTVGGAGTATLTLTGTAAELAGFLAGDPVSFTGDADVNGAASVAASVSDGVAPDLDLGVTAITVAAVNDQARGTPTAVVVPAFEETAVELDLESLGLEDPEGDPLFFILAATHGTLSVAAAPGVFAIGDGTSEIQVFGSISSLNAWFAGASVSFTGDQDYFGLAEVTVSVTDGIDPIAADMGAFEIDIAAVNDAPTGTDVPLAAVVDEDEAVTLDLSGLALGDVDGDELTLALTATDGRMMAATGLVTVLGSTTATVTVTGTAAEITAYLTTDPIQFIGDADFNGEASVAASISDGVAADLDLGVTTITVAPVDDAPTGADFPSDAAASEDVSVDLDLSGLVLGEVDGDALTLTLAAMNGTLAAVTDGFVTVGGSGTGALTLSGSAAALGDFLAGPAVSFLGAADFNGDAEVSATVSDGVLTADVGPGPLVIAVAAVNDAPTGLDLPATDTTEEDQLLELDLSGLALADVDGDEVTLTLTTTNGVFNASSLMSVTVLGATTSTLTVTGTPVNLATYLGDGSIYFTGSLNFNGEATVTASVSDGVAPDLDLGATTITVVPVNDAPTGIGFPSDAAVNEDVSVDLDLSGLVLGDVDGDGLTLTLAAMNGTLAAVTDGFVTVGGSGTGALTLSGSAAELGDFLAGPAVSFLGAADFNGDAEVSATVSDGVLTADVGPGPLVVAVVAVNDAPTGLDLPLAAEVTVDVAASLDLSGLGLDDIDGDALVLTLTATNGTVAAADFGGVTVADLGGGAISLSGSIIDLGAYLADGDRVSFSGAAAFIGEAEVSATVDDGTAAPVALGAMTITVAPEDLLLVGTSRTDRLFGGLGDDELQGKWGDDRLFGDDGEDILLGGRGNDLLSGGEGDDRLTGGLGDDIIITGGGADVIVFAPGHGRDIVRDFDAALDTVDLTAFALTTEELAASLSERSDKAVFSHGDATLVFWNMTALQLEDAFLL